jgi:catechol 2,3-dioxygenase-like lactoylglutathione lyase family enzyme
VARLQHVTLPIPDGGQEEGRAFYSGVLGLREKIVPGTRSGAGLVWFEAGPGELEVHLAPDPVGLVEGARRHFCLVVDDLEEMRKRIEAGGAPVAEAPPIPGRPRFYTSDPFGNLIEVMQIVADYQAA